MKLPQCHLVLFVASILLFKPSSAIWPFPPKRFKSNALIGAGSLGLDKLDGRVAAFGDFNGDQFLDVVTMSEDQHFLQIYLWDHEEFEFLLWQELRVKQKIVNVVPGDFDRDGRLDLLVMSESSSSKDSLDLFIYVGSSGGFDEDVIVIPSSTLSQPIAFDASGQMKIDLLGIAPSLGGNSGLTLWNNTGLNKGDPTSELFHLAEPPFDGRVCQLSNPHSNAVIDFNGDCLADIFLMCGTVQKSFQIWTNHKEQGFKLARTGAFPPNIGAVSFADMDRDGTIDIVFPTCASISMRTGVGSNCKINIVYNQQKPLCASSSPSLAQKNCRIPDELCTADPDFQFDFHQGSGSDVGFTSLELSSLFPDKSSSLLLYDTSSNPPIPIPLRIGDLDLDGFPDLVATVVHRDHSITPQVLISSPCDSGVNGCHGKTGRTFEALIKDVGALREIKDARGVALLDMDEDGTLDIMVQRTGSQIGSKVTFIRNNFFHDAFFLKAIVLNGACNGWCVPDNASEPRYHPFGVSYSGPSYKYTILDTSGRRSAAQVGQLPQTSYQALHTPYSFFGLGRTNNYIENLFVGSTKHQARHFINMEGVIPNSKVVIIPPAPGAGEAPSDWRRELYLRPGEWIPWVTLTVVIATVLLAVIVFVLHLNEKREDEMERRRRLHHINFDAL